MSERPTILDMGGKNVAIIRGESVTSTADEHTIRQACREIFASEAPTGAALREEAFAYIDANTDQEELAGGQPGPHFEW